MAGKPPPPIIDRLDSPTIERGVASVVFALLALPVLDDYEVLVLFQTLVITILGSVLLHGFTTSTVAKFVARN